jgi:hypothetical protein
MRSAEKINPFNNISRLAILMYAAVALFIIFAQQRWRFNFFNNNDPAGYYIYLPATFIYHDLGRMDFTQRMKVPDDYIHEQKTGKRTDKYGIGTAISELPFFLLAQGWCLLTASYPADGYSVPYQLMAPLSSLFWTLSGLFVLRRLLKSYFDEATVAATLICIAFGTNLYHYSVYDYGMSHNFSFLLFAAVVYLSDNWYRTFKLRHLLLIGIVLGLVLVTRPVNIIVVLLPFFWKTGSIASLKNRLAVFRKHIPGIALALTMLLALAFVQMAYWKYTSGHWIFFSYVGEYFDFRHSHIWQGLFSYRKGWFVYTPIAFIAVTGFLHLWKKDRQLVPSLIFFLILMIYFTFCWKRWWYGSSFGCRPLIECLAILSLPLAALIGHIFSLKRILLKTAALICITLLLALNIFQSYQFTIGIISLDRMTKASYWYVFGRTHADEHKLDQYGLHGAEYWDQEAEALRP